MNYNRLIGFVISFLSFISFGAELRAQRKFQNKIIRPLDTSQCYQIRWRVLNSLNSSADNGLIFHERGRSANFYFWVTESGAFVLFADSMLSTPLAIEKRNEYSFNPWTVGKTFVLMLPKKTDSEGWIRCQWREVDSGRILDEIWYCPMEVESGLKWVGWQVTGMANVHIR